MRKYKYNWFDELLYLMNLSIGDEEDIQFMENYKKSCIEYERNLKGKKEN